jgi:hypothetical protein
MSLQGASRAALRLRGVAHAEGIVDGLVRGFHFLDMNFGVLTRVSETGMGDGFNNGIE